MLMTRRPGRAKAKRSNNPSGYRRRPRTLELRFAERCIGPSDMVPVDVERGKGLVEHGLRNMSSEAVAQAVLTKEADLEWKRLRALASAWEIEVSQRHTRLLQILLEDEAACLANASKEPLAVSFESLANYSMEELKTRTAFSIAAYSQDRMSFIATDAQLDHLEFLAREHYLPTSDEDTFEVSARGQDSQAGDEGRLPASPTNSDASAMLSDEDRSSKSGSCTKVIKPQQTPSVLLLRPKKKTWLSRNPVQCFNLQIITLRNLFQLCQEPQQHVLNSDVKDRTDIDGVSQPMEMQLQAQPDYLAATTWSLAASSHVPYTQVITFILSKKLYTTRLSHPKLKAADLTHHDLNESNSSIPLQHRDNYGYDHRQSYNHDHTTDAYNVNLNIVNNPYNYNAGGSQQQPEWPVQTPVYQNPSNLPPNLPNPPLWPIHAQGHVGSSSHATSNPLSALEVPTHSFDFPLDSVHQKLNRGPRDFKSQHALYMAVASRRQSNSKYDHFTAAVD
ncbi:hypothetical protein EV424DRAFT_1341536 [Suillus variegatus]|nr:hypothetical protein EV424DRAFT_1341536 [Suillus variegatus]